MLTMKSSHGIALNVWLIDFIISVILMFELLNNDKQCYYQDIEKHTTTILEYQVSRQFL